uniref:Alanine racemase N-terminal domain-containing protein n=1 Tax=Tetradesmus obliquus TaxID=3088 RepID=A0A383VUW1_TETOB|eukprot:jgi/Sobl393_1/14526/SZX68196.1
MIPCKQYDGYGHGLREVAAAAAALNSSISIMRPEELTAAATLTPRPAMLRIKPASYSEALAAARARLGVQETATPGNIAQLLAAGRDANATIPVHLYLFRHYDEPWGWEFANATQLQQLIASLDRRYVAVRGIMMHAEGFPNRRAAAWRFLEVACPAAATLAPQRIAVHWMSSNSLLELLPPAATNITRYNNRNNTAAASSRRLQLNLPPACAAPNIEFWARLGSASYGMFAAANAKLPGVRPVLRWTSTVTRVGQTTLEGEAVPVAVVDVSPARFPAPSWWSNAAPFVDNSTAENDANNDDNLTAAWQPRPQLFVYIKGQRLQLAAPPGGNGSMFLVDLSGATSRSSSSSSSSSSTVQPGDEVCLLCEQQPAGELGQQLGADEYNTALCLRGLSPAPEATLFDELPNCTPRKA